MSDSTQSNQTVKNWSWRSVARIAFPIARKLIRGFLDNNKASPIVNNIGPIEYLENTQEYRNNADVSIALFITSVDNNGNVSNKKVDRIIFAANSTKPYHELADLLKENLAGNISWSVVGELNENGESDKTFVDLKNWNGKEISLFNLDDIPENDLHVKMEFLGEEMCMTASNATIKYRYELDVIIIDASDNIANFDFNILASSGSKSIPMGPDFNPNLPIKRAFFIGKAIKVQ